MLFLVHQEVSSKMAVTSNTIELSTNEGGALTRVPCWHATLGLGGSLRPRGVFFRKIDLPLLSCEGKESR
jgi:hypothetical protein